MRRLLEDCDGPEPDTDQRRAPNGPDAQPMLLTVKDVEAELQLGRTLTYELVRTGALPVVRIGRALRIPRVALERWIMERVAFGPDGSNEDVS